MVGLSIQWTLSQCVLSVATLDLCAQLVRALGTQLSSPEHAHQSASHVYSRRPRTSGPRAQF
ncbi:hypothetical protein BDR03DRAFT_970443, partial [Suillus americanus]